EERETNGPYESFDDFVNRVDSKSANKRVLEHLAKTGAFDFGGEPRKRIFDRIDAAMAGAAAHARDRAAGQGGFFDLLAEPAAPAQKTPTSKDQTPKPNGAEQDGDFTSAERLAFEKELLGFYVSGHPMNTFEGLAESLDTFAVDQLLEQEDRTAFRLCGIASNLAKKLSKKDNRPWVAFTLSTKRAAVPLNMFADAYAAYGANLAENGLIAVLGTIMRGDDGARINVKECYPLDNYVTGNVRRVTWLLHPAHPQTNAFLQQLRETLNKQSGDTRTSLGFLAEGQLAAIAEASTALGWKLTAAAFQQLRSHPAVAGVQIETKPLEIKETRRWAKR
ncbi:MAG TPA: DNA polymerase III subunit alpha, partial [Candidatus Synoicihabitans sp.]|nr:DNA polymerase III subunit alpha [Candidatus Synoicihabitans sp.]